MTARFNVFIIVFIVLSFIFTSNLHAQSSQSNIVLRAMGDELARSVAGLRLGNLEKPYFIEYAIEDTQDVTLSSSFGALTVRDRSRSRSLRTRVRVGSYDFDNTGFLNPAEFFSNAAGARGVPTEDDYNALRHEIWLATDAAYKVAIEQFARKQAFVQNKQDDAPTPDFSRETANVSVNQTNLNTDFDDAEWERRVSEMSGVFREFPEIQDSIVQMRVRFKTEYLVNSEGTRLREPSTIISLETRAAAQVSDGARVQNFVPFRVVKFDDLPSHADALKSVREMAQELTNLQRAPVLSDNYSGPVLLVGQASAEMFAQILAPQLADERPPLAENQELAEAFGFRRSLLADRLNRPVLPRAFDVTDDPTVERTKDGTSLIGAYTTDEQGIRARKVKVIEAGVLKDFLTSRRPRERNATGSGNTALAVTTAAANSNGHGRSGSYGEPHAMISNLFIEAKSDGKDFAELKRRLIEACQAENLQFGIIIRTLTTPLGANLASVDDAGGFGFNNNQAALSAPIGVYKVDVATGKEELVRTSASSELSVRSLRRLLAWGNRLYVHNRISAPASIPSGDIAIGVATTVIAPSVLVEEMEIRRPTGARDAPAVLTNPFFRK